MAYTIIFTPDAQEDIQKLNKLGDTAVLTKIDRLLDELREHPTTGTGKPKTLKGNLSGCWSRRITDKHRLVYRIVDQTVTVNILNCYGHYDDK